MNHASRSGTAKCIAPPHSRTIYIGLLCAVLTLWGGVTCWFCCPCCPGAKCLTRLESRYGAWPPAHRRMREGGQGEDTPTVDTPTVDTPTVDTSTVDTPLFSEVLLTPID